MAANAIVLVSLALSLFTLMLFLTTWGKKAKAPPGPPSFPIVGNMYAMPVAQRWDALLDMSKRYGSLIYFSDWQEKILVVTDYEDIHELMDSRASIYSGRAQGEMAGIIREGGDAGFGLLDFGPEWALQRKIFRQHMQKGAIRQWWPKVVGEARLCVRRALERPEDLISHVRLSILGAVYGAEIDSLDHDFVKLPELVVSKIDLALRPRAYWVDQLPFLKHIPQSLPGMKWLRDAREWGRLLGRMNDEPWDFVKRGIKDGTAGPSITSSLLEDSVAPEPVLKGVSGVMYVGAADTTVSTLECFFLAMLAFPEVQRKAQKELDRVLGQDRLPTLEDHADLPYIEAIVRETYRWFIIGPFPVPHQLQKDDYYKGYFIPKGTVVLPNSYAVSQDPRLFPEPERFWPERYLGSSPALDSNKFIFGYGRRICPGLDFANISVWATIATVLATVNVKRAVDANGNEIIPDVTPNDGGQRRPRPFKFRIEPRSPACATLLGEL